MKLFTKHTDYALRALIYVAGEPGRFVPSGEIAKNEHIPTQFLRRIVQPLVREKFLVAREGMAGGVKLNRRPADIRLTDVITLFQGRVQLAECMFRKGICPERSHCAIRARIRKIEAKMVAEFNAISIATLLKDRNAIHGDLSRGS